MKIAVVAVTKQGMEKGENIKRILVDKGHQVLLYVPGKHSLLKLPGKRMPFRKPLKEVIPDLMKEYDALVCIMALGIVVRLIAPEIRDKRKDPAVVVMDERGQNVISVLSGHWGGANELTKEIAAAVGANPVITTATDIHGLPAIEMLAKQRGWGVEPFSAVRKVNAAIVNSEIVYFYCDELMDTLLPENIRCFSVEQYNPREFKEVVRVVVTNKSLNAENKDTLFLRPKNLVVGLGCRRGVSKEKLKEAVLKGLAKAGLALESVREFASVEVKADEPGLRELSEEWNIPIRFFSISEINGVFVEDHENKLTRSDTVKEKIGVDGVCEPAALLAAKKNGRLILTKMSQQGVTVAIAEDI